MKNSNNNNNNNNHNNLFFYIWKSKYIKVKILNEIMRDRNINCTLGYIQENHKYLNILDIYKYNIGIQVKVQIENIEEYKEFPLKNLINCLDFECNQYTSICSKEQQLDILENHLPKYIRSLKGVNELLIHQGSLYDTSIETLNVSSIKKKIQVNSLPKNLNTLKVGFYNGTFGKETLPSSLKKIEWCSGINLDNLNKSFHLDKVESKLLMTSVFFPNISKVNNILVTSLNIQSYSIAKYPLKANIFKPSLRELGINILKASPDSTLCCGVFPSGLVKLTLNYSQCQLKPEYFPCTLTYLELKSYNTLLLPFILPKSLKHLILPRYDQPLLVNSIPPFLEQLRLDLFSQTLDAGVLPNSLTALSLLSKPTLKKDSIPCTVKTLDLNMEVMESVSEDMESFLPCSIKTLNLNVKVKATNNLLCLSKLPKSVKSLSIKSIATLDTIGLQLPSSIASLTLHYPSTKILFSPNSLFFPVNLKKLTVSSFIADYLALNSTLMPSTIEYLNINGESKFKPFPIPKHLKIFILNNTFQSLK
ncbi:hypothetical protein CYY_007549 [Polysphondylium violaceum]|uniref:FNIP repeat-containing protein n=1 Tax=Polysphondylium violaceum TaxID=133409 RepID=A0A8J4PQS5_9MYCE|nr:hypothetical protein CYY_007549 [Polysphondylium violaceum]